MQYNYQKVRKYKLPDTLKNGAKHAKKCCKNLYKMIFFKDVVCKIV